MTEFTLVLPAPEATMLLGEILGEVLAGSPRISLLLYGNLGAGKTTMVRGIVASLPGGEQAEVASPSFNIYNLYPTCPEIAHVDLYRLEGMRPDEDLLDYFCSKRTIAIVEWSENLPDADMPDEYISLVWTALEPERVVRLRAHGKIANDTLARAVPRLHNFTVPLEK